MSSFTRYTTIYPNAKTEKWITAGEGFRYYHYVLGFGPYTDVPAGFEFDGCSIPVCILGPKVSTKTITPCCLHDWLIKSKKEGYWMTQWLFYGALKVNGNGKWTSFRYFIGVCVGSWRTYYSINEKIKYFLKNTYAKLQSKIKRI